MIKTIISKYYAFLIAITVLLTDQTIKCIISEKMLLNENIPVLNHIFSITKIYNSGAAFGILQNKTFFLTLFSLIVIALISAYLVSKRKVQNIASTIAWGLILGGTIGNLIDRLSLGYVLDFIKLDFVDFPIFNIADLAINCGAALLIIYMLFVSEENKQKILEN